MFSFLTFLKAIVSQYLDSLQRDLGQVGFNMVLIIEMLSLAGIVIVPGLIFAGQFQMPTDGMFYAHWFGVTLVAEITLTLTLLGLLNTSFFAASGFRNLGFAVTAVYAVLFLGEKYTTVQIVAVVIAVAGSLMFFNKGMTKSYFQANKGLFLILFSLLLHPLSAIFYKAATRHTSSYAQFLSGRLVMDLVFYSLFFVVIYAVWYRKSPWPAVAKFINSRTGLYFTVGSTVMNLLGSWLIFKIPISTFTVLSTVSIPTAYFIGRQKYKELFNWRHLCGATLIVLGVILFLVK